MSSSPSQQYCLRWNNYQNNLTNVFDQLLQSEAFVDVTLACEGHSLKAHKVVLSACSPYFQSLFFDNPCKHPIVILNGIKWDELKSVVEFMYRGEINVSQEHLAPLLKVAEVLKIRGLADVSRVGGPTTGGTNISTSNSASSRTPTDNKSTRPQDFNVQDSGSESPSHHHHSSNGTPVHHPLLQHSLGVSGSSSSVALSSAQAHQMLASLSRRKRRKMSTPERTPSPPDELDDHSNQLEIDSTNGDYDRSPRSNLISESPSNLAAVSMSLTPTNNSSFSSGNAGTSLAALANSSAASLGPIGPALLNLHAAAAAAAAVANASNNNSGNSSGGNHQSREVGGGGGGGSSSVSNDLDIKPGIVEMIREEERAKMLESAHGWLGPSSSTLSESYQYQIQNLWQKCWNQNQTGMMHALRFRERGPLKSWRPETMAEAIFAVLREGLSLSQAARKYDIPYPTFVLYANRVHNMLGPSADGSSNSDLMSDMRPKGRGRPQRILLGTWPEEHIRGVIRAVVFRDTQATKDDIPSYVFNRDGGLCLSSSTTSGSNNGLDMSLHPQFLGGSGGGASQFIATPPPPSSSAGQSSSSQGAQSSAPSPLPSSSRDNNNPGNLINQEGSSSDRISGGAHQHLQIQMSQGNSASSSASSSPLQQALNNSTALSGIGAQAQSQLLALQQRHLQQQLQLHQQQHNRRTSSSSETSPSNSKFLSGSNGSGGSRSYFHRSGSRSTLLSKEIEKELLARSHSIKTEVVTPYDDDEDEDEVESTQEDCSDHLRPGGLSSGLQRGLSEDQLGGEGETELQGDEEMDGDDGVKESSSEDKSLNNNNDPKISEVGVEEVCEGNSSQDRSAASTSAGELNERLSDQLGGCDLSKSPSPKSLLENQSSS